VAHCCHANNTTIGLILPGTGKGKVGEMDGLDVRLFIKTTTHAQHYNTFV